MVKTSVMIIVLIILYDVLSNKNTNLNGSYAPINETQNSVSRIFSVNLDKLKNLKIVYWKKLDDKEKLSLLQYIADIQCVKLGIPNVSVTISDLDNRLYGLYSQQDHVVYINESVLEEDLTVKERITSVIHEVYHAYQHAVIEVYEKADAPTKKLALFKDAVQYKKEFEHYANGLEDNLDIYVNQKCEEDAREYADKEANEYMTAIGE